MSSADHEAASRETGDASERRTVVHRNEVKEAHTSHWDIDTMTDAEIEALYRRNRRDQRWLDATRWAKGLAVVSVLVWLGLAAAWWFTR